MFELICLCHVDEIIVKLKRHVNLRPGQHFIKDGLFILKWLDRVVNFVPFRIAKNDCIVMPEVAATEFLRCSDNTLKLDVCFLLKINQLCKAFALRLLRILSVCCSWNVR